ncbi:unnamed protein product [Heterobilharzia americana]|nr:unnamed protein product [Heterobilharzia americana]
MSVFSVYLKIAFAICFSSLVVTQSVVNRRICRNAVTAQEHHLLSECIKEWRKYPWEQFRVDNSPECSTCRIVSPFVWDSKIAPLLCSTRMNSQECKNIINALSQLRNLKNRNEVLCNILTLCDSHGYIKDLNFGAPLCDDCKRLVNDMRKLIEDNSTAVQIEAQLDELVCDNLPGEIVPYCKNIINVHVPYVLHMIAQSMSPDDICTTLGFCGNGLVKFTLADFMGQKEKCHEDQKYSWIRRPTGSVGHKWTSYSIQETPSCADCLNVLNQFKRGIEDSNIRESLKKLLDEKVCSHMGFFTAACREAVEYNFDQILSGVTQIDAKEVCSLFMMCPNKNISFLSIEKSTSISTRQNIPGVCQLCELIVKKVFELIAANRTERQILLALETPKIELTSGIDACLTCKFFIETIYGQLQDNKTEDELKQLVKGACSFLPGSYADRCSELVDRYFDDVLKLIENNYTPEQICHMISLCPRIPFWSLSEQNPCLLGAEYWCRDYSTAKMCNAVQYCSSTGWKTYPSSNQNKLFKSQCELMKLPEICVNSELAKKCNRVNECYQEQVKKFLNLFSISSLATSKDENKSPCSVCVIMTTRWLLQWDIFGGPIINRNICDAYKDEELEQCYQVIEKAGMLLIHSRKDRQHVEQICARTINCSPAGKEENGDKQLTYEKLDRAESFISDKFDKISCLSGPTYWCSSKDTAKKCNATNYCQATYWPEVNNNNNNINEDILKTENSQMNHDNNGNNVNTVVTPLPVPVAKSEKLLGIKPCTWGPAYWCISEETAKKCGDAALMHCKTKIWINLPVTTTPPSGMYYSHEKCTRGPTFWCASFENAKLCGEDAERHCINVVWSNIHKSKLQIKP